MGRCSRCLKRNLGAVRSKLQLSGALNRRPEHGINELTGVKKTLNTKKDTRVLVREDKPPSQAAEKSTLMFAAVS